MGSRTRISTTTKKEILKKRKADMDRLSTREAQVLRMRHGITEPPSSTVARPPKGTGVKLRKRVRAVEEEIIKRIRDDQTDETDEDIKNKIVRALKDED